MAERKPGPVKPPTIELTARPVEAGAGVGRNQRSPADAGGETARPIETEAADTAPSSSPAADPVTEVPPAAPPPVPPVEEPPRHEAPHAPPPPPPPPFVPERPEGASSEPQPWQPMVLPALAGALLGTVLTYLLATVLPLPSSAPTIPDPAPRLADNDRRLGALEASNAAIAEQLTRTQSSLDVTITQLDGGLAELRKAIDDALARVPAPADLTQIETRLRAVSSRLDAVAAGASSADSDALAQSLTEVQSGIAAITARLDDLEGSRTGLEGAIAELRTTIADLDARLGTEVAEAQEATASVNRAAQADALADALNGGRPFRSELDAIVATPGTSSPVGLEERAAAGLPSREELAERFAARVPDMMAARPGAGSGAWQDQALDWFKAMLAVRPAGEVEGDTPDAVMSRLEAAMARHDFVESAALFEQLPPEMRAAAGDVAADVAAWAAAEGLIGQLRASPAGATQ